MGVTRLSAAHLIVEVLFLGSGVHVARVEALLGVHDVLSTILQIQDMTRAILLTLTEGIAPNIEVCLGSMLRV